MAAAEDKILIELDARAKPIIEKYQKRAKDKSYYDRVRCSIEALTEAGNAARNAARQIGLYPLDSEHSKPINLVLGIGSMLGNDLSQVEETLNAFSGASTDLGRFISCHTGVSLQPRRGRKPINYVSETQELMRLYEEVTGRTIVFPKESNSKRIREKSKIGIKKEAGKVKLRGKDGGAQQLSTEFIRRSLVQIDKTITTSKAITCIRNALKQNAELNRLLNDIVGAAQN